MNDVVKQLRPLVSEHCPQTALEISVQNELLSMYRKQNSQDVADALKKRETMALAKERLQRQRRSCPLCGDDDKDASSVIECSECKSHACVECFQNNIRVQCGQEDRYQFVKQGCSIVCCMCRSFKFLERDVFAFVDDATIAIICQARADVVELQAYNKAKSEFQAKLEEMKIELIRIQGAAQQRIYRHRLHICDNILTLKCPRPDCGMAILDFDGCALLFLFLCCCCCRAVSMRSTDSSFSRCFAVSCTCGCAFCGWCMADCGRDAHSHVKQCPSSANPGTYYGSVEQFEAVHREKRRVRVLQYLGSLPKEEADQVGPYIHVCLILLRQSEPNLLLFSDCNKSAAGARCNCCGHCCDWVQAVVNDCCVCNADIVTS